MNITNTIKTQITLHGVTIPGNSTVWVDGWGRLKSSARVRQLLERGTLVEGEIYSTNRLEPEPEEDEQDDDEEPEPTAKRWFRG